MRTLAIETPTHGRVLVRDVDEPAAVVVAFHGYSENAEIQMHRLVQLPHADRWTLAAVQGLHRFYRGRSQDVIASWMTRQDRELMIRDNIEYASRAIESLGSPGVPMIVVGFSQGVAMAFRAAVRGRRRADGVVAVGGDVPPELLAAADGLFPPALLLRGRNDEWYTAKKLDADVAALESRGVAVRSITFHGGHEWNDAGALAASAFIRSLQITPAADPRASR